MTIDLSTTTTTTYPGIRTGDFVGNDYRYWLPTTTTTPTVTTTTSPTTPAPAPVPPHLQFSANAVGTPTMLIWGTCRTPGQIIWAAGVDATSSVLDTSYLTFAASYGEPIDYAEPVRINRMWANGTLFYDYDQGGVVSVANLDASTQATLASCVDSMEIHYGGPQETPSAIAEAYLGTGNVPAYRGLRTVVFPSFPLMIAGNTVPNVTIEWKRTDSALLDVADGLAATVLAYAIRNGLSISLSVDGLESAETDKCYGLVISGQAAAIDFLKSEATVYRARILDGSQPEFVRRLVDTDLTIDLSVNESNCVRQKGSPTIGFDRVEPTSIPTGIDFQYSDPANYYDTRVQQARHEGSGPSVGVASLSTNFIVDATTARKLAYDTLYDQRTRSLHLTFELDNISLEPSDTIELTTTDGDVYTCIVEEETHTKTRSGGIRALALLTSVGVDVDGDGGRFGGGTSTSGTFSKIVLLTGFEDGADGSTSVVDLSSYHHGAATARGNAQIDTAQSKFGNSSGLFDGSGDSFYWPGSVNEWALGTSWTIECWVRFNSSAANQAILSNWTGIGFGSEDSWLLHTLTSQALRFFIYDGSSNRVQIDTATSIFTTGQWYHVAVTGDGAKVRMFLNGVMVGSQIPTSTTCGSKWNLIEIGDGLSRPLNGWVDEVRIAKGYSFYSSDAGFTPPTSAFPRSDAEESGSTSSSAQTDEDGMMLIF